MDDTNIGPNISSSEENIWSSILNVIDDSEIDLNISPENSSLTNTTLNIFDEIKKQNIYYLPKKRIYKCSYCRKPGHYIKTCKELLKIRCSRCRQFGHYITKCNMNY